MAAISLNYKRSMKERMNTAIKNNAVDDALILLDIWPDLINEKESYKYWLGQQMMNAITAGALDTVKYIVALYPPIINESDLTPLILVGMLCSFLPPSAQDPIYIAKLHQIALFLVKHPDINVLKYRAGSITNRACYYCQSIDNEEFRHLLYEKEVAAGSMDKVRCARWLDINVDVPAVASGAAGGAGGGAAGGAGGGAGHVINAVPTPKKGPGARTAAEIAMNARREAMGENVNWESAAAMLIERREGENPLKKGGRRQTKKAKRRYRKSQKKQRHFL
jgi:hypothetical protein